MFVNRYPMTRVFETLEELDIKFPATAGEATFGSPIVFKWSDDIEPYSYIEKMHQFVECWCTVNHKTYLRMTSNSFSKPSPDKRLIDKMSVEVTERDFDNAPVEKIDFVFDISEPFRAVHGDLSDSEQWKDLFGDEERNSNSSSGDEMEKRALDCYNKRLHEALAAYASSDRINQDNFANLFSGDVFLISEFSRGQCRSSSLAIHEAEVLPLIAYHYSRCYQVDPLRKKKSASLRVERLEPSWFKKSASSTSQDILLQSPKSLLRDLYWRLRHLLEVDLSAASSWVWHGDNPHPVIGGKVHYLHKHFKGAFHEKNVPIPLPISEFELVELQMLDNLVVPKRFALTMPDGLFRPFETTNGFVGTQRFAWLGAHEQVSWDELCYEGVPAENDQTGLNSSEHLIGSDWSEQPIEFNVSEYSRAFRPTTTGGGFTLKEGALRLISGSSHSMNEATDVFAIADCSTEGEKIYRFTFDGDHPVGPEFQHYKHESWGALLKSNANEHDSDRWHVFCFDEFKFSKFSFLRQPKLGPRANSLIGEIAGTEPQGKLVGAVSTNSGEQMVPFIYQDVHVQNFGHVCMVFSDHNDQHVVFDENGQKLIGPLSTFECPPQFRTSDVPSWHVHDDDAQQRKAYVQNDLPMMFAAAKAKIRFGDLSTNQSDLSAFAGRIVEGHLDAMLSGIWRKKVEVIRDIKVGDIIIKTGQLGIIEHDIRHGDLSSSKVYWLTAAPVMNLLENEPKRVLQIPYECLRILG